MSNIVIDPSSGILEFNTGSANGSSFDNSLLGASRLEFQNSGQIALTSLSTGVSEKFTVDGPNGRLFTVDNEVTGSIFSINDAAGLPIVEVFSDDRIIMGQYATDALVISGSSVQVTGSNVVTEGHLSDENYVTSDEILTHLLTVDGANSNLDADKLDGQQGSYYLDYGNFSNTPTVNDVSETNLLNRLAALDSSDTIYIGDAGDDTTVVVRGTLQVDGSTTTINSNTLSIGDNQIVLNNDVTGTPTQNAGIIVERGTATNASLIWDESNDYWKAGLAGSEVQLALTNGTYSGLRAQSTTKGDVGLGNVTNESKATMFSSPSFTGDVDVAGSITTEGPDGGMVMRTWTGGGSYGMIGTANMSGGEYSLLTDGTSTYLSGGTGGNVYIRGGNNDSDPQITVSNGNIGLAGVPSKSSEATAIVWDGTNIGYRELGSAAFSATSAFATAAQGTSAENALPLAGGTMTGHILLNNGIELRSKDTSSNIKTIARVNSSNQLEYGWSGGGPVKFMGGGSYTERMRIHTNGNVGIGTTSPAKTLDVSASGSNQGIYLNISDVGRLHMYADGSRNYFAGVSGNGHRFTTTGGANVEILNNGNVGIGDTTPSYKLDVNGTLRATSAAYFNNDVVVTNNLTLTGAHKPTFSTPDDTVYTPDSNWVTATPFNASWHDLIAFGRNYTTSQEVSTDGSTFSSETTELGLFAQKDKANYIVIDSGERAVRWTWTGVAYNVARYFQIAATYSNPAPSCTVKVETSSNGTAWTEIHSSSGISFSSTNRFYYVNPYVGNGGHNYVRLTLDKGNADTKVVRLSGIKMLTQRLGDQGKGREDELPFYYDKNQNIGLGVTSPLRKLDLSTSSTTDAVRIKNTDSNGGGLSVFAANGGGGTNRILTLGDASENIKVAVIENGNVGIGTTSPTDILTINETADSNGIRINGYDDESSSYLKIFVDNNGRSRIAQNTDGSSGYLFLEAEDYLQLIAGSFIYTTSEFRIYDDGKLSLGSSADFKIKYDNSTDKLNIHSSTNNGITMDTSGNVGIGTVSPSVKLEIQTATNTSSAEEGLRLYNAGGGIGAGVRIGLGVGATYDEKGHIRTDIVNGGAGRLLLGSNGTDRLVINENGKVLVNGAEDNSGKADFAVSGGTVIAFRNSQVQMGGTDMNWNSKIFDDGEARWAAWDRNIEIFSTGSNTGSATARDIIFSPQTSGSAASTERMRIKGDGNVGIGTTSPTQHQSANETVLHIADSNVASLNLDSTATNGDCYVLSSTGSGDFRIFNDDTNTTVLNIDDAGNVGIGTDSPDSKLHVQGALLLQVNGSDQNSSEDSTTNPSTTTPEFMRIGHTGTYSDGRYTHEWVKLDRVGNLPLYLRQSKGTANSFENIARFGEHSYSAHRFEVFGSIAASGATFSGDVTAPTKSSGENSTKIATTAYVKSQGYVTSSGNTIIGTDSDINTSGAAVLDQLVMTDGVITSHSTRNLTLADLGYTAPNAPASASAAIVGNTVEVTFAESTTSNIDSYLVYSSIDGSDYGLISIVPPDDFAASMSIIDNAFDETGTQAYRVYAMKYGILSSAATDSVSYSVSSAEPTTMSVINLNNAYYVQWNPPSSNARFVTAYNVYKHEHATQGSLSRGSASLIYSGMNTNYMYQISGTNNNNFHQFWVETTIA